MNRLRARRARRIASAVIAWRATQGESSLLDTVPNRLCMNDDWRLTHLVEPKIRLMRRTDDPSTLWVRRYSPRT